MANRIGKWARFVCERICFMGGASETGRRYPFGSAFVLANGPFTEREGALAVFICRISLRARSLPLINGNDISVIKTSGTEKEMPAWTIQSVIDEMLSTDRGSVDYIHGVDAVESLAAKGALGIILPDISKETFFRSILSDKAFPRKTFSIGHAEEKRYYIEARRIR